MWFTKAHAYGNDFLYVSWDDVERGGRDLPDLARALCDRHTGVGADGLIAYRGTPAGASMRLTNADGSPSEVSGNGVRALAALLARGRRLPADGAGPLPEFVIDTDAGPKRLTLIGCDDDVRFHFRADMGQPAGLRQVPLEVAGDVFIGGVLSVGNPQCVVLGPPDEARLGRLGPALQDHPAFPEGVNVEIASVEAPDRVRIVIWERGVGPTRSSGTGSCAAAIVAAAFGGATRDVEVVAPGGSQRVEWRDDAVYLTGWAEVLFEGHWVR
jgi:diaminopimelate epimerase